MRTELREASGLEVSLWPKGRMMLVSLFPVYKLELCRAASILTSEEHAQPGTVEGGRLR